MPNALDKEELLCQNLIDAGCDEKLTEEGLKHFRNGTLPEFLTKLKAHLKQVLSDVRKGQKQIDCLDYLTYKIKSEEKEK